LSLLFQFPHRFFSDITYILHRMAHGVVASPQARR
jgi:hypothetical protein